MMVMIGPSDPNLSSALKNQCKNLYRIMGFFFCGIAKIFFNVCKCVKVFFFLCVCVFVSVSWSLSCVSFFGLKKQRERDRDREIWFWENHGVKDVSFRFRSSVFSWVSFLILSWRFQKVLFCFCFFFFLFSFFGYTFLLFILLYFSSYLLNNLLTNCFSFH